MKPQMKNVTGKKRRAGGTSVARAAVAVACAGAIAVQSLAGAAAWAADDGSAAGVGTVAAEEAEVAIEAPGASAAAPADEAADGGAGDAAGAAPELGAELAPAAGVTGPIARQATADARTVSAAFIVRDGASTPYGSVEEAVDAARSGDVIALCADAGDIVLDMTGGRAAAYTLDLAGHAATSLTVTSNAAVAVMSSTPGGAISGASDDFSAAVFYSGSGSLSLSGVDVFCSASDSRAYGVYAEDTGALSLSGGSVGVSAPARGASVCGVSSEAERASVSIESCPITVEGSTGSATGVEVAGDLAIAGEAGTDTVVVSAFAESSAIRGIRASGSGAAIALYEATVRVAANDADGSAAASQKDVWCVVSGTPSSPCAACISLDGACAFESSTGTDILAASPLEIGAGFALDAPVTVWSERSGDHALAQVDSAADASSLSHLFEAADGSPYAGWRVEASGAALLWAHDAVAVNRTTGESYPSVEEALSSAQEGDTVALTSDAATTGAVEVSSGVALDLAGHTWSLDATSSTASAASSALAFTGEHDDSIGSSSGAGRIEITVGRAAESTSTARTPYAGIEVAGGALSVSGCTIEVSYAGATTASPQVALYGVSVESGSVELGRGARLVVRAAATDGTFGAVTVAGVHAGAQASSVAVGAGATVEVRNNAAPVRLGQVYYPDDATAGANADRYADLVEVPLVEGSDFYNEVQQAFRESASFDSESDAAGFVYGSNVYYVSSLELPSGQVIWACSDPVSPSDAGALDSVVATHVFVRSLYQAHADAWGVDAASGFAGAARVDGDVSAATDQGRAAAVKTTDTGDWSVSEGGLSASCGTQAYRASMRAFDLREFFSDAPDEGEEEAGEGGIAGADEEGLVGPEDSAGALPPAADPDAVSALAAASDEPIVYPSGAEYTLVEEVLPAAAEVAGSAGVPQDVVALTEQEASSFPMEAGDPVELTFSGGRTATGTAMPATMVMARFGEALGASGASVPRPADFSQGGVTYRFIGWSETGASSGYAIDADSLADFPLSSNVSGADEGAATLYAVYVSVAADEHLVEFDVDCYVTAYAVDNGARPSFADCYGLSGADGPDKQLAESGVDYAFAGWSSSGSASADFAADDPLPVAAADAVYTACFEQEPATVSVAFAYYRPADGGYTYSSDPAQDLAWSADATAAAAACAQVGDTVRAGGFTYTFLGWSTRQSDTEPLFTDSVPATLPHVAVGSLEGLQLYGIYSAAEQLVTVNFYTADGLYAMAANLPASTTIYSALAASDHPGNPAPPENGVTFRGWNTDAAADTYLYANITRVGDLADADGTVSLFAIWTEPRSEFLVTFYDADRTTVLFEMPVEPGSTVFASQGEDPRPGGIYADLFTGWVDASGDDFSPTDTAVTSDMSVYAAYLVDVTQPSTGSGIIARPEGSGSLPVSNSGSGLASAGSGGALAAAGSTGAVANTDAKGEGEEEGAQAAGPVAREGETNSGDDAQAAAEKGDAAATNGDAADAAAQASASQEASNIAGVAVVAALAAALAGSIAWWLVHRRLEEKREREEEALEDAAAGMGASGAPGAAALATESIRF